MNMRSQDELEKGTNQKRLLTLSHYVVREFTDEHSNHMINISIGPHGINMLHAEFQKMIKYFALQMLKGGNL